MRLDGKYRAVDVQELAGVGRDKAIELLVGAGAKKDKAGRWALDASEFLLWYNRGISLDGGAAVAQIDFIVEELRLFGGAQLRTGIQKRKGRAWELRAWRYVKGERKQRTFSLDVTTKREAERIHADVLAGLRDASAAGIVPVRTEEFMWRWLDATEPDVTTATWKRYRSVIHNALPFMAEWLHENKVSNVERFKDFRKGQRAAAATIVLELNALSTMFKKGQRLEHCKMNPCDFVSRPKKPQTDVQCYTADELELVFGEIERLATGAGAKPGREERLAEAWRGYREVFYTLLYTGMRLGDVLGLRWQDVYLDFRRIRIEQKKTKKAAEPRIVDEHYERLMALRQAAQAGQELVHVNTQGNAITQTRVDAAIRRVLENVGLKKRNPLHSFRHTYAMTLVNAGVPDSQVAAAMGDTPETIYRNYIRAQAPDLDRTQAALGKLLSKPQVRRPVRADGTYMEPK